ncbi:heme ABC transporter ATP-binding protein [Cytophagaceae bacterium SJW1-29]|uniref:Heme ABC transporter ATP-binding protein n=2 Tax=Salmonirosea aquatica TaxID=2654236 RepID=A0A7C9BKA5_9BACT|nr:heme ABC transporter ATP-binding protein [Cytophagaceae bacterium SJW1-29]
MLKADQLHYKIGARSLIRNVSLRVRPGELLAIVGPNGAGKSTLLKLCAGEIVPQAGTVTLNQQLLSRYTHRQLARVRAVLHQQNTLSFPFRVSELVLMGRYPHYDTQPDAHDYDVAEAALNSVGMGRFAGRYVATLSGGEQQRIHLARVLAQLWEVPDALLLLDEPTTGLDLLHQQQILATARQMAERGYAVVAVLHDLNMAAQYAHHLLMLKDGTTAATGSPREVLTAANVERVFDLPVQLIDSPLHDFPLIVPLPATNPIILF